MTVYGFNDRTIAERLKLIAERFRGNARPQLQGVPEAAIANGNWWVYLHTDIDAFDTDTGVASKAIECTVYYLDEFDTRQQLFDQDGDPVLLDVYHFGPTAIAGQQYVLTKTVLGRVVVDVVYCQP